MNAEEIALRLGGTSKGGQRGYMCLCPVHQDNAPSLSVMDGDNGKLLVNCFSGCNGADVIAHLRSLGLIRRMRSPRQKRARGHIARIRDQLERDKDAGNKVERLSRMSIAERLKTPRTPEQPFSCSIFPVMPFDCPFEEYRPIYEKRYQTWRERAIYGRLPWEIEDELDKMRAEIMEINQNGK